MVELLLRIFAECYSYFDDLTISWEWHSSQHLHEKTPVFLGSADDITELLSYGDVQQPGSMRYEA